MKAYVIHVDPTTDSTAATRSLQADTPEKFIEIQSIRKTIEIFKEHLANLSTGNSSLELKKDLFFGGRRVTVICGKGRKGLLVKLRNLLRV